MADALPPELLPYADVMDGICSAMLVDFADADADEDVPIGRLLIEWFNADEKGFDYPDDLPDLYITVGELRHRTRKAREAFARQAGGPPSDS